MSAGLKVTSRSTNGKVVPSTQSLDASYSGDDADWDGTPGVGGNDQWKQPVVAATTGNITIASALNDADTLDGVTLATGDRVLVKDQSTSSENGIYVVGTTPARAADMDADDEVVGALVYVVGGTANAATAWAVTTTTAPTIDTDAIAWAAFGAPGALDDLSDVNAPSPTDQDVLTWDDGAGEWIAQALPGAGGGDASGQLAGGFDGGGSAITAGSIYYGVVPFDGTITDWIIQASGSSNAEFDVALAAAGTRPTFPTDSIVASAPPSMTADDDAASSTLTGWTTALTAGQRFAVKFVSGTATWAQLVLNYSRP